VHALGWGSSENSVREDVRQVAMRENQTSKEVRQQGGGGEREIQRGNKGNRATQEASNKCTRWSWPS
jgi:hypothetical protein